MQLGARTATVMYHVLDDRLREVPDLDRALSRPSMDRGDTGRNGHSSL
jgi:hypothetical protein